ncbi:MAG: hypothetical protein RL336_1533 [Pseudomonadota bacterium]|jgi:hypothetical protein
MRVVIFVALLLALAVQVQAQPVDQVVGQLEEQYQAKVISVQERRGGLRVRLLQQDGVVKTINYRPEGWRPPPRPRLGDHPQDREHKARHERGREKRED